MLETLVIYLLKGWVATLSG